MALCPQLPETPPTPMRSPPETTAEPWAKGFFQRCSNSLERATKMRRFERELMLLTPRISTNPSRQAKSIARVRLGERCAASVREVIPIRIEIDSGDSLRGANQDSRWRTEEFAMAALPLRDDFDAERCRAAARRSKDGAQTRRLLSIAAIYEGSSRAEAARLGGVTAQIVRDWVERFNQEGPEGLVDRKAPGKAPLLGPRSSGGPWHGGWTKDRSRPSMAWCAGGSSISRNGSTRSSASQRARTR